MKIFKEIALHYNWGDQCDGWHLVKNDQLSVIFERMPPNTREMRHSHNRSRQFFFIIRGTAVMEMDGEEFVLEPEQGIEVPPQTLHQMMNRTDQDVEFLVISQPNSHGDRVLG